MPLQGNKVRCCITGACPHWEYRQETATIMRMSGPEEITVTDPEFGRCTRRDQLIDELGPTKKQEVTK